MSKKKVLILSSIQGHASLANSAHDSLKSDFSVEILTYPDPALHVYRFFYRKFPSSLKYIFKFFNHPLGDKFIKNILARSYKKKLFGALTKNNPDAIVSVNYGFDAAIEMNRNQIKTPYINIMPDPKTFFPFSLSTTADQNLVFDQAQQLACNTMKPTAKTKISGWFVQEKFEQNISIESARKKINIFPNKLTLLLVSGSEGAENIISTVRSLFATNSSFQLIIICGSNKSLKKKIDQLVSENQNQKISAIIVGFTKEIEKYMYAADLVVGKAGPNSLFEAVATSTPFMATTHNAGLEDGNLDIIRDHQLGYVEENPTKAEQLLLSIIKKPQQLEMFTKPVKKMAAYNKKSKQILLKLVKEMTSNN
jgi:UDP-N-acetylglucosamine:LPS N-acetylglucosamine transferase